MRNESGRNNSAVSAALLRPAPREVRLNASGVTLMILCLATAIGGLLGGVAIYRHARQSERHVLLFASESVATEARIVSARQRGDDNRRTTVDYEYTVDDTIYRGEATVRGPEQDGYVTGSSTLVTYLPSSPAASWIQGRAPSVRPAWPAFAAPAAALTLTVILLRLIRLQRDLLRYGRPASAVVTNVKKKRSDKGTYWQVEYKWTLLSGAPRTGTYRHSGKQPPSVGTPIPIVYDRDVPSRNMPIPAVAGQGRLSGSTKTFPSSRRTR